MAHSSGVSWKRTTPRAPLSLTGAAQTKEEHYFIRCRTTSKEEVRKELAHAAPRAYFYTSLGSTNFSGSHRYDRFL